MIKKLKNILKSTDTIFYLIFIFYIIIVIYSSIYYSNWVIKYSTFFLVSIYLILKKYWLKIDIRPNINIEINQDFLNLLIINISIIILILNYFVNSIKLSTNSMILVYLSLILIYIIIYLFSSKKYYNKICKKNLF